MLRLTNLSCPLETAEADYAALAAKKLRVAETEVLSVRLWKKSIDARDKADVHLVLTLDVTLRDEARTLKKLRPGAAAPVAPEKPLTLPAPRFALRPVVAGAGPAGLFAALTLAQAGARPILVERGRAVEERTRDVDAFRRAGALDPESNVQFGEGGAGAFSDGKLTTGTKSPLQRHVLETFVRHGAPEDILWLQKPHIGSDNLPKVVASMRREILALGGEVRFSTRLTGITVRGGRLCAVRLAGPEGPEELATDTLILCIGHSAGDTLHALFRQGVRMAQKPFAIGVRIEQPQRLIDRARYGRFAGHPALPPADYKLNVHTPDGRGVYTFCMCPGGEVIASSSQPGGIVTNGMSRYARDGVNANAALLVGVRTEDFGDGHPLAGFLLQREIEKKAFAAGGGDYRAPAQLVGDFLAGRPSKAVGRVAATYLPGVTPGEMEAVLPAFITGNLRYALPRLDGMLHGFADPEAVLTAPETRSSSPVRIPRGEDGQAEGLPGLYPAGEGAGYAGGIMSAAVDGISAALKALSA